MSPAQAFMLIVVLGGLLCVATLLLGALWWRLRSVPPLRAIHLTRELGDRVRSLELLVERLETALNTRLDAASRPHPVGPLLIGSGPRPAVAVEDPRGVDRPTLIAVPDLTARSSDQPARPTDLAQRFGTVWDLAERGEPADAIARATGQPIGQVELILGLRRQLVASEGRTH